MSDATTGVLLALLGGLCMGTCPWPLKRMRKFGFEHFAPISMLAALLIAPYTVSLIFCPNLVASLRAIPGIVLLRSNLVSLASGIAQVLCMLCFVRIGVSLTYGILTAVGASVGVIIPLIFKGSGPFAGAPDVFSPAGLTILCGIAVMLAGIVFATLAGFGRERATTSTTAKRGGFGAGLVMVIFSGIFSAGWLFVVVYSAGPVKQAVLAQGAPVLAAELSVWTFGLLGATVVNLAYPLFLVARKHSWRVFAEAPGDIVLSVIFGLQFFTALALMGQGAVLLKGLGPSVGWGTQQGMQIITGFLLGFISGEWSGVTGRPRLQVYVAALLLVIAIGILSYSRMLY